MPVTEHSREDRRTCPEVIVLVTMDSVRRDHLGCYGYERGNSPFLDEFATVGTRFENAISNGGATAESFPSIMASCPPPIRIRDRGVKSRMTLARLLKETGFATAGFHSNPFLSAKYGYDSGFDDFFEGAWSGLPPRTQSMFTSLNQLLLNKGPASDGATLTRMAISWLRKVRRPAFLWLHFMDTHVPYLPRTRITGLRRSMRNRVLMATLLAKGVPNALTIPSSQTKEALITPYDECIREVDRCIAMLFSQAFKLSERRMLIVTSDHGEAFWEHGYFGHSGVYEEVVDVPLIIYHNDWVQGTVRKSLVTLADILPTIADQVGQSAGVTYGADTLGPGQGHERPDRRVVSTSITPLFNRRWTGVRSSKYKFIRQESLDGSQVNRELLFNLSDDPSERTDLSQMIPEEVKIGREEISRLYAPPEADVGLNDEESEGLLQRLRSLGYA